MSIVIIGLIVCLLGLAYVQLNPAPVVLDTTTPEASTTDPITPNDNQA